MRHTQVDESQAQDPRDGSESGVIRTWSGQVSRPVHILELLVLYTGHVQYGEFIVLTFLMP